MSVSSVFGSRLMIQSRRLDRNGFRAYGVGVIEKVFSIWILSSSVMWAWISIRRSRKKPIVVHAGRVEKVPVVALAFALIWVVASCGVEVSKFISSARGSDTELVESGGKASEAPDGKAAPSESVKLSDIKTGVYQSGLLAFVIAVVYSLGVERPEKGEEIPKPLSAARAVSLGILALVVAMGPVLMVQLQLAKFVETDSSHPLLKFIGKKNSADAIFWVGAAAVVTAPLLEELIYRVILQGWFRSQMNRNLAVILSAVIFSFVHGWPAMVGLFPLAVVLGVLFDRTNSYLAVVTTHAAFNMAMLMMSALKTTG